MKDYFSKINMVSHDYIFDDNCFWDGPHANALYSQAQLMTESLSKLVGSNLPDILARSKEHGQFESILTTEFSIDLNKLALSAHSPPRPNGFFNRMLHTVLGI